MRLTASDLLLIHEALESLISSKIRVESFVVGRHRVHVEIEEDQRDGRYMFITNIQMA